jgi:hypothetical protein
MTLIWFRIEAPHFVAAGDLNKFGRVEHAAPIIDYMRWKKWSLNAVKHYCKQKQWKLEVFGEPNENCRNV